MAVPTSSDQLNLSGAAIAIIQRFWRTLAQLAFAVLALSMPAVAQKPTDLASVEANRPEVKEVRIKGVKSLSKSELRDALSTQASSCKSIILKLFCLGIKSSAIYDRRYLDEDEFKRDVLRVLVFYFRRGFREAHVDTTVVRGRQNDVRITFSVIEGPPTVVERIGVAGVGPAISRRDSVRGLRPNVGTPLNLLALDSSIVRLRLRLWEQGFADAVLTPTTTVDDSTRTATVLIAVNRQKPVTIGDIWIEGNKDVSEETIMNSLALNRGELFRISKISYSQRSLYESALFRRAVIDTAPRDSLAAKQDSVKNLVVRVLEGPQREARTSVGFTTADFVQADAAFTHNYFLHRALRLDAGIAVGNLLAQQLTKNSLFADISNIVRDNDLGRYYSPTYQANVTLTQRWFRSPRNTLGAGLLMHRRSSPGVLIDRGFGANATFTRELAIRLPLSVRYQFEVTNVDAGDVYFCVNYGVCDNVTIKALRGQQNLSPVSFTVSLDRTDIPFSPTRGVLARAEVEHASIFTGSEFRYNRAYVDAAAYQKIGRGNAVIGNTVAAVHVRAGWVHPLASTASAVSDGGLLGSNLQILHPRKRFYAGGAQSVRGFGENQLGPRVLTVSAAALAKGPADTAIVCSQTAPSARCLSALQDDNFQTRPLGGTTLLEGSAELRIPVYRSLVAAVFVDGAILGNGSVTTITKGTGAVTPGFGFRYQSPVGPIRVDLGIRPTLQRALPVITEVRDSTGRFRLVDLTGGKGCPLESSVGCRIYPGPIAKQSFINRITNRLTLHLSIGEAY